MTPNQADVLVLQTMIDAMVGIPQFSYPARQNSAPKPEGEFAHIRLLEEYQIGIPNSQITSQDATTSTSTIFSPCRLRFRVGVVDTTGIAAIKIMHGWTTEVMKALMISSGYGFVSCRPLSNEDTKLEKEWEYRQGFSIEMYTTRKLTEVSDLITSAVIDVRFEEGDLTAYLDQYLINP